MELLPASIAARIPPLYGQEGKGEDAIAHGRWCMNRNVRPRFPRLDSWIMIWG